MDTELLGKVPLGVIGWDIELNDNTAFLACFNDGVVAVDLTDPSSPRQIGSFSVAQVGGGSAVALTVVDDLAYVAFRVAGLKVLDVSDPHDIREIGRPQGLTINANNVAVDGSLAFVTDYYHGLWVFDVSQPDAGAALDLVEDPGRTIDAAAESGLLVVASAFGGLPVFDTKYCRFGEAAPALSWQPAEPVVGQLVHFTPLELDADEWEWRFDDGPVMTGMLPIREFRSEGAKVVSLTVTSGSSVETYTRTLEVTQARPRRAGGRISPSP